MPTFSHGHALVIGVGDYQDTRWSAPITLADAQAVAAALEDPLVSAYRPDRVRLLQGDQATRAGVTTALQQLAQHTQPSDTVVIFFAGHGGLGTDGVYHFATHETVFEHKKIAPGTGLPAPDLIALLRAIRSQKLLLIVNACFSGHLAPTLGTPEALGAPPAEGFNVEVLASGEGRAIISASRPTQYSYYMPGATRTFFGQALVEGLRGKAANGGGYIGLYELYQHLYTAVKQAAAGVNGAQEPVLTIMQGVGPFPVALYPGAGNLGAPAIRQSPPSGTAVEQVPRSRVQAIGLGAQAFNIQSGEGAVTIDQGRKLIDFGGAQIHGSVTLGDVAGGNITKIDITIGPAAVAKADTKQELLDLIAKLQAEVAGLKELPEGDREDAADNLGRAQDAGAKDDKGRLLRNLESAQKIMIALAGAIPVAQKLGETIGALIQKVLG